MTINNFTTRYNLVPYNMSLDVSYGTLKYFNAINDYCYEDENGVRAKAVEDTDNGTIDFKIWLNSEYQISSIDVIHEVVHIFDYLMERIGMQRVDSEIGAYFISYWSELIWQDITRKV